MKKWAFFLISTCLLALLAACGGNVDGGTADKYKKHAEEAIQMLNEKDYDGLRERFDSTMERDLTTDQLKELEPMIEDSGTFEKFEKASVEEKDGYYVTVTVGKYSEDKRVYTITFNKEDEISGLYIK